MEHLDYLQRSIDLAVDSAESGGGPFGAVIVAGGKVLAAASNKVTSSCDPTAHAEVVAIREACEYVQSHQLTGCVLYASCEPCPMCLGAIYWARLDAVYYAATREQAAEAGFDDSLIYREVALAPGERRISFTQLDDTRSQAPFAHWHHYSKKTPY